MFCKLLHTSFVFLSFSPILFCHAQSNSPELDYGLRTRWETAEFNDARAHALTLKARVNITYEWREEMQTFLQIDHVSSFNDDKHSTLVFNNNNPVIADPEGTEINQVFLRVDWADTFFTLGRQKIVLSDARFIGDVGFRQNDQTFDALRIDRSVFSASQLTVAYLHNVNRIFGNEADNSLSPADSRFNTLNGVRPAKLLGNHHVDAGLFHLNLNEWEHFEFALYGHSVHNYHADDFSNRTVGVESKYRNKFGAVKVVAAVELAVQKQQSKQSDWIPYRKLSAGFELHGVGLGIRHEKLSQRDGVSFITPLATLHKFQGWADQFLETPVEGLEDNSISLKWTNRPWVVDARYHRFDTDFGSVTIGEEFDLDIIYRPARKHEIKLRYADFNADANQTIKTQNVNKLFLMYTYNL